MAVSILSLFICLSVTNFQLKQGNQNNSSINLEADHGSGADDYNFEIIPNTV